MVVWDWKYRIFFQNELREEVNQFIDKLNKKERVVYQNIVQFYSSFYSFDILLSLISEKTANFSEYIQIAEDNLDKVIKTPNILYEFYINKISKLIISSDQKNRILHILNCSISGFEIRQRYWDHVKYLLGDAFDYIENVLASKNFTQPVRILSQDIIESDHEKIFKDLSANFVSDRNLTSAFGTCAICDYNYQIIDGGCYGEWWDSDISTSGKDELYLYTKNNVIKYDDFKYTILHEMYPGHGHFYNYVKTPDTLFDHGAMMLIEGWATYCEWNCEKSEYISSIKHNALNFLYNSFNYNTEELSESIIESMSVNGFSNEEAIKEVLNKTQYVGFYESYYLGSLWVEFAINCKFGSPQKFLDSLKKVNKGELFRLWL